MILGLSCYKIAAVVLYISCSFVGFFFQRKYLFVHKMLGFFCVTIAALIMYIKGSTMECMIIKPDLSLKLDCLNEARWTA